MNNTILSDLLKYQGEGIHPNDFDTFWNQQLLTCQKFPVSYEVEKVTISSNVVDCFQLIFESHDGVKISCQLLKPKNIKKPLPGLLMFHGYHTNSGDYSDKIGWASEGHIVLAMDCRGQSGQSEFKDKSTSGTALKGFIIRGVEQGKNHLYYEDVFLDTVIAARVLMDLEEVEETEVYVQGSSQGGALALVCSALVPNIKKVLVTHPFLCDYRKAYTLNVQNSAYEELFYWFRFRDPLHENEEVFFNTLEYIDVQHFTPRIKAKVIMITGLEDIVCHPITQFAAYNKINSPKKLFILPEYGHEYYPRISDKLRGFIINDYWNELD